MSVYVSLMVVGDGSRTERSAALSVDSYFRVYSSAATRSNSTSGRPSIPRRCHRPGPKSMPRNATSRNHPLVADLCAIKRCYTRTLFLSLVLSLYVSSLHYTYLYEPLAFVLSFVLLLFLYVVLYFFFFFLSKIFFFTVVRSLIFQCNIFPPYLYTFHSVVLNFLKSGY